MPDQEDDGPQQEGGAGLGSRQEEVVQDRDRATAAGGTRNAPTGKTGNLKEKLGKPW